jgi:L-methionine (R)-S-oxide reductase
MKLANVKRDIDEIARTSSSDKELMARICKTLNETMLKYSWVGFYLIDAKDPKLLVLGPYVGTMTPIPRIRLDEGICGVVATTGVTVVVDDVRKDARYLAGSHEIKSEIAVPVFVNKKVVGDLDIDSHFLSSFGDEDRTLVEYCAQVVGKFQEQQQNRTISIPPQSGKAGGDSETRNRDFRS